MFLKHVLHKHISCLLSVFFLHMNRKGNNVFCMKHVKHVSTYRIVLAFLKSEIGELDSF